MISLSSPFMLLTSSTLITSTLMAVTSSNWIFIWGAMELNLLSFIPIIMSSENNQEIEGSVKYFLAQALGSAMLLMSSTSLWVPHSIMSNLMPLMLTTAIFMKLGTVPCHFWFSPVMSSLSWNSCLILSTWQKLAPLSILAFLIPMKYMVYLMLAAGLSALIGGILTMNQTKLRSIMAYSSISHMGWMISLIVIYKPNLCMIYFLIYSIVTIPIFIASKYFNILSIKELGMASTKNITAYMSLIILLLSLGGLPPLTGFAPKLMTIMALSSSSSTLIPLLITGSLMSLYMYLNITITMMLSIPRNMLSSVMNSKAYMIFIFTMASSLLGLIPLTIM